MAYNIINETVTLFEVQYYGESSWHSVVKFVDYAMAVQECMSLADKGNKARVIIIVTLYEAHPS